MDISIDEMARQELGMADMWLLQNQDWRELLARLTERVDLNATAKVAKALVRRREIREAADLLQLVLVYAMCDWSLRLVAMWCAIMGIGNLSDVAVLKRLQRCEAWLGILIAQLLPDHGLDGITARVRLMDATVISRPGSTGTDWRVHLSWDLGTMTTTDVAVTDAHGAEYLDRFPLHADEIVVGDRGYAYASSLEPLLSRQVPFVVRCNWQNVPLEYADGSRVQIADLLRPMAPRQVLERPVWLRTPTGRYAMRLIIGALPQEQAETARRRMRRSYRKKGKQPRATTLLAAGYTLILTTLPLAAWSAQRILTLYGWRWQIEVYFKRLKSVVHLDHLRAKSPQLARVYLLGKLLGILLLEMQQRVIQQMLPEWWNSLARPLSLWRLTDLLLNGFIHTLVGPMTSARILAALPRLHRFLCDTPRRRTPSLALARARLAFSLPVDQVWLPLS